MSKLTRKCPNCGTMMPADVKYCRKCHARMDTGRVEVLDSAVSEPQKKKKRPAQDDALRNLPRPVRPAEPRERTDRPGGGGYSGGQTAPADDGFYPNQADGNGRKRFANRERRAPAGEGTPRPVSTARGGSGQPGPNRSADKNLWQIITVLAIIFVIIVVAIVLVIRLNRPSTGAETSDPYENANVITSATMSPAPTVTAPPTSTPAVQPPDAGLIVPDATPVPAPSSTPVTITPIPSPSASPNAYNVTPVSDTVYISGNGVNVRSGPGTNYSVIGSENTGKQLARTGKTANGWSQVAYNGQTGYVIDSLLTSTQPSTSTNNSSNNNFNVTEASGTVKVTASSGANLRSGPGTGYSIVATVAANTQLTRTGTTNGWTRVSYNGQNVYISTNLLDVGSSTGSTGGSSSTGSTGSAGTITVTGNGVRIRSGPGTGYGVIGSANSGNVLTLTGQSGDWYQVSYNGQTGYISASYARKN